jgi:protein gp37
MKRIADLRAVPARVRFLSCEPLLGPLADLDLAGIDWAIAGGESGRGRRPVSAEWIRHLRDQCTDQDVPFFFKQWGGYTAKAGGRTLDGRTWDQIPVTGKQGNRPDATGAAPTVAAR